MDIWILFFYNVNLLLNSTMYYFVDKLFTMKAIITLLIKFVSSKANQELLSIFPLASDMKLSSLN